MHPYNPDMSKAPQVGELTLCVPTGRLDDPLAMESGHWDPTLRRWEGDWRWDPDGYADQEPIGWALVVEPQAEIRDKAIAIANAKIQAAAAKLAAALAPPKKPEAKPAPRKASKGPALKVDTKDKETFDAL